MPGEQKHMPQMMVNVRPRVKFQFRLPWCGEGCKDYIRSVTPFSRYRNDVRNGCQVIEHEIILCGMVANQSGFYECGPMVG